MILPKFDYFAPESVKEAVELLDRYGDEGKVLAGGMSLLPVMKLRLAEPEALIDINRISDLAYLREEGDSLRIGALTRVGELHDSDLIKTRYPLFFDAAAVIADPLVDNMGTVGGNIAHGDPANDLPACMLALGAEFAARGPNGSRTIPAADFFEDTFETVLQPNELLTEIQVPKARKGQGSAYFKLEKRAGDFPIVGVAANLIMARKKIEEAGIGLTAVGPTPISAAEASDSLVGNAPDGAAFDRAAELAEGAADPTSDLRGPAEYKTAMVGVLVRRALNLAAKRAGGGG